MENVLDHDLREELQYYMGFPGGLVVKNPPADAPQVRSLGQKDSLEKERTTHSRILVWEIPWTEEPGGLESMGLQRDGHD